MSQVKTLVKCAVFAIFASQSVTAQEAEDTAQINVPPVFVQTLALGGQDTGMVRQFFGTVAALKTVDISFEVGGYIQMLDVREGARIDEGTLIARLDIAPFNRAITRAELALAQAERDLARATGLATRNVGSQVQADNAETARDLAQVALAEAQDARSDAEIRTPFDALVADRIGTPFVTIEPGQPVVRLHNMSEVRVEFDLPERLLAQIPDPSTVVFTGFLSSQSDPIPLTFREFRTETSGVGQSYNVSLAVDAAATETLLPGRTITVQAALPRPEGFVSVPVTAVFVEPDGTRVVFSAVQQGDALIAQRQVVTVQSQTGTTFDVSGLEAQSEIITVGAHLLSDAQPVQRYTGLTVEGL